jgi:DNA-binding transcriptional LysR family regulator
VELKIEVKGPLTLGDTGLMVEAALDRAGIAFAFELQVEPLIAARKLVRVLEDWCPYYGGFNKSYPGRRQVPPAQRAFN